MASMTIILMHEAANADTLCADVSSCGQKADEIGAA
jgi:hypothetical protein